MLDNGPNKGHQWDNFWNLKKGYELVNGSVSIWLAVNQFSGSNHYVIAI